MAVQGTRKKLCIFCKHFRIVYAFPGYSEWTPGSDMEIECGKGVWKHDNFDDGEREYRRNILKAEKCELFVEVDENGREVK